jgi:sporulation protein YlmC with PRC-barrel domain
MIRRAAYTVLLLALAFAVTTAAVAAGGQIIPQMDTGHTDRPPQTPTVSEKPDQIRASAAIGGKVVDAKGNELATITDLIASRKQRSVEFAILDFGGDNGRTATAWGHLLFEAAPAPHFVTVLSREALAADRAMGNQEKNGDDSFHIKNDLMGKKAVGADGANLGEIEDVVVTW